jgi:hypothetical protein
MSDRAEIIKEPQPDIRHDLVLQRRTNNQKPNRRLRRPGPELHLPGNGQNLNLRLPGYELRRHCPAGPAPHGQPVSSGRSPPGAGTITGPRRVSLGTR